MGLALSGLELDLVMFKTFSNLNNSVVLCCCFRGLKSSKKEQEKWKNNSYRSIVRLDPQREALKKFTKIHVFSYNQYSFSIEKYCLGQTGGLHQLCKIQGISCESAACDVCQWLM